MRLAAQKTSVVGALIVATGLGVAAYAAAGDKVTGGAEYIDAGGVTFSMTANAIATEKGVKGHIQYSREAQNGTLELYVHAPAKCMWVADDGMSAVVAGPAHVQSNPGDLETGPWLMATIREGGTGAGDSVGVVFVEEWMTTNACLGEPGESPDVVMEGNFTIRRGQ